MIKNEKKEQENRDAENGKDREGKGVWMDGKGRQVRKKIKERKRMEKKWDGM